MPVHMTCKAGCFRVLTMSVLLSGALSAQAAAPAVSGINGKFSVEGGNYNGEGGSVVQGSFSAPLGHAYGIQLDGGGGRLLDASYSGGGAHLFWRDPARGLIGLTGLHQSLGGIHANQGGAEGELYLDDVTIHLATGYQGGNVSKGGYQSLAGRYYFKPNLAAQAGFAHFPDSNSSRIRLEWLPGLKQAPGVSVFFTAERASQNYDSMSLGLRYYFGGGTRTLQQRHRGDDPDSLLMAGIANMMLLRALMDLGVGLPPCHPNCGPQP